MGEERGSAAATNPLDGISQKLLFPFIYSPTLCKALAILRTSSDHSSSFCCHFPKLPVATRHYGVTLAIPHCRRQRRGTRPINLDALEATALVMGIWRPPPRRITRKKAMPLRINTACQHYTLRQATWRSRSKINIINA